MMRIKTIGAELLLLHDLRPIFGSFEFGAMSWGMVTCAKWTWSSSEWLRGVGWREVYLL
jgi:hypothetical protein